jgi:hypothetical protein
MGFFKHFFKSISTDLHKAENTISQDATHLAKEVVKVAQKAVKDLGEAEIFVPMLILKPGMKAALRKKGFADNVIPNDNESLARMFAENVVGKPNHFESLMQAPRHIGGPAVSFRSVGPIQHQISPAIINKAILQANPFGLPTQQQQQQQQQQLLTNLSNQAQIPLGGGGGGSDGGGYTGDMTDPMYGYNDPTAGWGQGAPEVIDDGTGDQGDMYDDDQSGNFESINEHSGHKHHHHHRNNPGANFESVDTQQAAVGAATGAIDAVVPGAGALPIQQIINMIIGWFKHKGQPGQVLDAVAKAAIEAAGKAAFLATPVGKEYKKKVIQKDVEIGVGAIVALSIIGFGIYEAAK